MLDSAAMTPGQHRLRRWAITLLFAFYGLLLVEGPLRKWVLPGASNALVFLRDPVAIALLLVYLRMQPSPAMRRVVLCLAAIIAALLLCVIGQFATSAVPPLAILTGFRNYVLFVPVCVVIADTFSAAVYAAWVRLNLWLAGPIGALVVAQYLAPPSAWINAAPGGEHDGVFLLAADVVRPYGLFSFTLGHSAFAVWMLGVALAGLLSARALQVPAWLVACGGAGVLAMGLFSGTRTYILLAACVLATFFGLAMPFGSAAQRRRVAVVAAALVVSLTAAVLCVPTLLTQLADRQASAVESEGPTGERVARVETEFVGELQQVPPLGYGLGSGTNVANFLSNGRTDHVLAEYELTRIVQELGPYFGLLTIVSRWGAVLLLARASLRAARRGNLHPACYLGFVAPVLLVHDVTLQNSMIGIAWFAVGILLASLRLDPPPVERPNVVDTWEAQPCV